MTLSSRDFLLRHHPKDWWTQSLEEHVEERKLARRRLKCEPPSEDLCTACRAIDFEYFFLGDADSGYRYSVQEGLELGTLAEVEGTASHGCPVCRNNVLPLSREILDRDDARLRDGTNGPLLTVDCISVHLVVSDIEFSREAPSKHRSGGVRVSLRKSNPKRDVLALRVNNEWELPFEDTGPSSASFICLVDHELSVHKSVLPKTDLKACSGWLSKCQDEHKICQGADLGFGEHNEAWPGTRNPGFRLIDVASRCVVQTGDRLTFEYATLSYVCGPPQSLYIISDATQWDTDHYGRPACKLPDLLPQTLNDAIEATASLGLRYLWIDSICIAQDDRDEQKRQIDAMYRIYSSATICIIAAPGLDSSAGLPGVSTARSPAMSAKTTIKKGLDIGTPQPPFNTILQPYRWMRRAWTYQELILSKRCLIFTESETFFYCASSTWRESQIEDANGPGPEPWAPDPSNAYLIGNFAIMQRSYGAREAENNCRMYAAAVEEYTKRELSYQTDGLNAFQGLSTLIGQILSSDMILGTPKTMLLNILTWRPESIIAEKPDWPQRRMVLHTADGQSDIHLRPLYPSWSWISWRGPLRFQLFRYMFPESQARFFNCHSQNVFSRIRSAPELRHYFCTRSSKDQDTSDRLENILPMVTKIARFRISPVDDAQGQLEIFTEAGALVGSCDTRGIVDIETLMLQSHEAVFAQIWCEHRRGKGTSCNVALLKTFDFPASVGRSSVSNIRQTLAEEAAAAALLPTTSAQSMRKDERFLSEMKGECPPSLVIDHRREKVYKMFNVLLATRLGVGYIDIDAWVEAEPQDALVFLG